MEFISIYRHLVESDDFYGEGLFKQGFIAEGDPVPEGWTTDFKSLDIPEEVTIEDEVEKLQQQNTNLELALVQLYEAILSEKGGE